MSIKETDPHQHEDDDMKPVQLNITVTLDEDVVIDLLRRAVISATGIDPQREACVRASQHANLGGQKPPEDMGLLIDTKQACKLLHLAPRTIWQLENDGRMPAAIRIGGRAVRWSYDELRA